MYHDVSSWMDSGLPLALHQELGTRDQANLVRLDGHEEMVWIGTQRGRLLSYLVNLETGHASYSRFNIDVKEERVIDILTSRAEGVISITRSNVLFHSRGGVGHLLASRKAVGRMLQSGPISALEQMCFNESQLVVGTEKSVFNIDPVTGNLTSFVDLPHAVSKIHSCSDMPGLVAVGGSNGSISFLEQGRLKVPKNSFAHPSQVTSISSAGNYVFTTGKRASSFFMHNPPDVFVKVFDLRTLRHPLPLSVPNGALRVHHGDTTARLLVLSSHGEWLQGGNVFAANDELFESCFQTECFQPHSPDLDMGVIDWSIRSGLNAMLDSAGVVHFWASTEEYCPRSSCLPIPPRQPTMPFYPMPIFSGNQEMALENLGKTRVYSDTSRDGTWTSWFDDAAEEMNFFFSSKAASPPAGILPVIAENCKPWEDSSFAFCPNTFGFKYGSLRALALPKQHHHTHHGSKKNIACDDDQASLRWKYCPVDYSVNHSLFPFSRFNKTNRSGLENGQGPLDALNPLLQTLYNISPLKSSLKAHICPEEGCLSCELGFLFHMMDEARFSRNKVCQPVRVSRLLKRLLPGIVTTSVSEMFFSIIALLRTEFANRNEQHLFNAIFGDGQEDMTIPALVKTVELNGPAVSDPSQMQLMSVVFSVSRTHAVAIIAVTDELDTQNQQQRSSRANSLSNFSTEQIPEQPEWLLFNDFFVSESSLEEATAVPVATAAKPALAFFVNNSTQDGSLLFPSAIGSPVTVDMFKQDFNLSASTKMQSLRFEPLSQEELEQVQRGDFTVALDTEFISIGLANMEIREDGSREIGKPGDMAVGRVSVLRASNGVPLIDHYVSMQESEIKDFVTRFSGIRPGDLDARTSPHWLVSSKSLYTKLRFLVDCGCKFVGHGLHTDFRIINLWVSASSLIDTVELFHISGQRFLSLKFLASKLLNKSIQGDEHCSIEDARTALELFRLHQRLVSEGTLESTIKSLYETGRASGWK